MKVNYYGEYHSVMTQQNGCVSAFVSEPKEDLSFPPQVSKHCEACSTKANQRKIHGFRLLRTHTVSTDRQLELLKEWCKSSGNIPMNVSVD